MYQALGSEDSKNDAVVMGFALPAYMTVEIDGNQLPPLGFAQASQIALDGRIALLDQEGIDVILGYFADAAAPDQGQDVKNRPRTPIFSLRCGWSRTASRSIRHSRCRTT